MIGASFLNAGVNRVKESQLRAQAERVGAQVVLVSSQYTHTVTGAIPLTVPTTSTTTSSGSATAYGAGGSVTATGTGTSTTTGSQTVLMPYSVQRADFGAVYFARVKSRLGPSPLPYGSVTARTFGGLCAPRPFSKAQPDERCYVERLAYLKPKSYRPCSSSAIRAPSYILRNASGIARECTLTVRPMSDEKMNLFDTPSMFESNTNPTTSALRLITGLPELPPMMSFVETKL